MSPRTLTRIIVVLLAALGVAAARAGAAEPSEKTFRAGAFAADITPRDFPVIVNGYFNERKAKKAHGRLRARCLVLDDGREKIAVAVIDSCMVPRDLLDRAKSIAHAVTGIPTDRMLIAATHAHSCPAAMGALGSDADESYRESLPPRIAKGIEKAAARLRPPEVEWGVVRERRHNHCRRWIYRPDRVATNPFGERTVRADMHPGHESSDHVGPAGPADTDLSLLAVRTPDGRPIAVLANYAMHYFSGGPIVSPDFCGRFGKVFGSMMGGPDGAPAFVGIMSQGTSGDSMRPDYSRTERSYNVEQYTKAVARSAVEAYRSIDYREWAPLRMKEVERTFDRRTPDEERLGWARSVLEKVGDRPPRSRPEIYAREQFRLHEQLEVEVKLQALRIGDLAITAIPNEVYGLTGLKLKAQSPLRPMFNIELANGAQGYIPPPHQHALGGYSTWEARTAGLDDATRGNRAV